ncbi:uncharacterized protein [Rutidosis leptorrhynchoides]|uniref:uncharacterized protein n=1 Tax=Rutidosis leptorrhynchoides TaxID=125765 RepID=UPI003A99320D
MRAPTGRTSGELADLNNTISACRLNAGSQDGWEWLLDSCSRFTVRQLGDLIDEKLLMVDQSNIETLCNNLVPKKVELFVWRARKGRLPVRIELHKRKIDLHSTRCPVCAGDLETIEHGLLSCHPANDLWN